MPEVRRVYADAARVVLTGDLVRLYNPGAYHLLRAELKRMPMHHRFLVGNHDDWAALLEIFPETATVDGFVQIAEDLGDARLLYLDTLAVDDKHHGELCPARVRWIAGQIEAAGDKPLLVLPRRAGPVITQPSPLPRSLYRLLVG